MANIGCLGEIPFIASASMIQTLEQEVWSGSAKFKTHERAGGASLTEFVGSDPDKYNFVFKLSAFLGVNPWDSILMLLDYERNGKAVPLVLGDHAYGRYRWNVLSHKIKAERRDGDGLLLSATVSVNLQEYLRE